MSYKVIYHLGADRPTLKTKASTGFLHFGEQEFSIVGEPSITVPYASLRTVELFRLHGAGRMLKVVYAAGTLFVSVLRFTLFGGRIASVSFIQTGKLRQALLARMPAHQNA